MTLLAIFEALVGANAIWETTVYHLFSWCPERNFGLQSFVCMIKLLTVRKLSSALYEKNRRHFSISQANRVRGCSVTPHRVF